MTRPSILSSGSSNRQDYSESHKDTASTLSDDSCQGKVESWETRSQIEDSARVKEPGDKLRVPFFISLGQSPGLLKYFVIDGLLTNMEVRLRRTWLSAAAHQASWAFDPLAWCFPFEIGHSAQVASSRHDQAPFWKTTTNNLIYNILTEIVHFYWTPIIRYKRIRA